MAGGLGSLWLRRLTRGHEKPSKRSATGTGDSKLFCPGGDESCVLEPGFEGHRVGVFGASRRHAISRATYFTWNSKDAEATLADVKRMRALEAESAKLKRMYPALALENAIMKDVLSRKLRTPVLDEGNREGLAMRSASRFPLRGVCACSAN